jgi:uncharacterized protein (DUF1501 family)
MSPLQSSCLNITRRYFFRDCGVGVGKIALASLLSEKLIAGVPPSKEDPLAERPSHFPAKAKAVIHLFMAGAPSHLELFDHKPELRKIEGKPLPESVTQGQRLAFIRSDAAVMGPQFQFAKHGQCGMEISEALPYLSKIVDDVCLVRSCHTDQFNHAPAQTFFQTGFSVPGRPSIGSWVTYGLGCVTKDLPAFVVMSTGSGISGGSGLWSSGFLPSVHSGVRFRNQGDPILNVSNPPGVDRSLQRDTIDLAQKLNQIQFQETSDPEISTRLANYEMAFRMQTSAPELMDLRGESKETLQNYGCDPAVPSFARACLLARRMIERGVRYVNIFHEGWDAHSDVLGNHRGNCKATDQASAALVSDLKNRGLLDETLVVWGGEFGRTPMVESNAALGRSRGRDHHPKAYSMWMAGGGIRPGFTYGTTDDLGYNVTQDPVHVHDIQATLLHCLGIDHERLTFRTQGRDYRLTDVHGKLVQPILL